MRSIIKPFCLSEKLFWKSACHWSWHALGVQPGFTSNWSNTACSVVNCPLVAVVVMCQVYVSWALQRLWPLCRVAAAASHPADPKHGASDGNQRQYYHPLYHPGQQSLKLISHYSPVCTTFCLNACLFHVVAEASSFSADRKILYFYMYMQQF